MFRDDPRKPKRPAPAPASDFDAEWDAAAPAAPAAPAPVSAPSAFDAEWDAAGEGGAAVSPDAGAQEAPSTLDGIARMAMQGLTFGHTDELSGAAAVVGDRARSLFGGPAAPPARESFERGRAQFNADIEQFRHDRPWTAGISEAAGSVMLDPLSLAASAGRGALTRAAAGSGAARGLAGALLRAGQAATATRAGQVIAGGSLGARAVRAAATGSAYGAVAGAGYAEPGERGRGAAIGASLGAVVGSAAPAVVAGAGRLVEGPGARSARLVTRGLERAGTSVAGLVGKLTTQLSTGQRVPLAGHPGEVLADLGGDQLRRLADYVTMKPSAGSERVTDFLERRALDRPERLTGAAERAIGAPRGDVVQTQAALEAARKARADHLYGVARSTPPVDDQALLGEIADDEVLREAAERARRMVERKTGVAQPPLVTITRDAAGKEVRTLNPQSVAVLDLLKKGGDDVIQTGLESRTKLGQEEARTSLGKLHGLLARLDEIRPEYAAARAQFGDDMAIEEALAAGQRVFAPGTLPEAVGPALAATPPAAQPFYRQGAARQLYGQTEGVDPGGNRSLAFFRKPTVQAKLDALAPDDAARAEFRAAVERERGMQRTETKALRNSASLPRAETIRDVEGEGLAGALQRTMQAVRNPFQAGVAVAGRLAAGVNERVANSLADALLSGANGRGELVSTLQRIAHDAAASTAQRAQAERMLRTLLAPRAAAAGAR